ncbi:MAG TPA: response regulator transcription factor [Thermoanaerobaculia bacterium]|nr:response regulator transcription factor [Thermoanaerobaculia bacterium]
MSGRGRTVLVVDDDAAIRGLLTAELRLEGYETLEAADGRQALDLLELQPDLVLTDLAMPAVDGFELIAQVRRRQKVPIVVLSVRGGESDKIRALDLGADDYVVKPPSLPELLARLRAQLRRTAPPDELRFPDLTVNLQRRRVVQGGREVKLTPTEFALLELFATHAGKPLFFNQIIDRVWRGAPATSKDTVRVHVASLRRKLEPDASNPRYLVTEPWIGYRFIAEPL